MIRSGTVLNMDNSTSAYPRLLPTATHFPLFAQYNEYSGSRGSPLVKGGGGAGVLELQFLVKLLVQLPIYNTLFISLSSHSASSKIFISLS